MIKNEHRSEVCIIGGNAGYNTIVAALKSQVIVKELRG